jgi:hypothetical protein
MASILIYALLAMAQTGTAHDWNRYGNARYGTTLSYPAGYFPRRAESANGDGVTLTARDGATLRIFGTSNAEGAAPAAYVEALVRGDARYRHLSYRLVRPGFAVLSGSDGGRLFYERYAFGARSGEVHAFVLDYPAAARARYDPIIPRLSASLR